MQATKTANPTIKPKIAAMAAGLRQEGSIIMAAPAFSLIGQSDWLLPDVCAATGVTLLYSLVQARAFDS